MEQVVFAAHFTGYFDKISQLLSDADEISRDMPIADRTEYRKLFRDKKLVACLNQRPMTYATACGILLEFCPNLLSFAGKREIKDEECANIHTQLEELRSINYDGAL